eukprot:351201-Chlamydomonas_euryale.AAC.2
MDGWDLPAVGMCCWPGPGQVKESVCSRCDLAETRTITASGIAGATMRRVRSERQQSASQPACLPLSPREKGER